MQRQCVFLNAHCKRTRFPQYLISSFFYFSVTVAFFFKISESQLNLLYSGNRLFSFDSSYFLITNVMHTPCEKHRKPHSKKKKICTSTIQTAVNIFTFIYITYLYIMLYLYILCIIDHLSIEKSIDMCAQKHIDT